MTTDCTTTSAPLIVVYTSSLSTVQYRMAWFGTFLVCFYISKKITWAMQLFSLQVIYLIYYEVKVANGSHFVCIMIAHTSTSGFWRVGLSSSRLTDNKEWLISSNSKLAEEAAFNWQWHCYEWSCARTKNTFKISLPCRAVLSKHGWISRPKLAWFGMLQLGMIPIYITKSRRAVPNRTMPSC